MVVEGYDDLTAVVHLMKHYVHWSDRKEARPVEIQIGKSITEILDRAYISTVLKQSGLRQIGFLLDANSDSARRWARVQALMKEYFPGLPEDLSATGLIAENPDGLRLGVWLMPNNRSNGMLEHFLSWMVPRESGRLWAYARRAVETATRKGAPCRKVHFDKAVIHTFLAWQDPPGERFGVAISNGVLNPRAPSTTEFVEWFCRLYELDRIDV